MIPDVKEDGSHFDQLIGVDQLSYENREVLAIERSSFEMQT